MTSPQDIAKEILAQSPFPLPRHRVACLLGDPHTHLKEASGSKWVLEIEAKQWPDGSWGRFHSQDSKRKQMIRTTEAATSRLATYAMPRGIPVVDRACAYMEGLLADLTRWPDPWEKNLRFARAVPQFIASKLAMFGSEVPAWRAVCDLWLEILFRSFDQEIYNPERTDAISRELLGVEIDGRYLGLHSVNCIYLFGGLLSEIPEVFQRRYLRFLRGYPGEIAYTQAGFAALPPVNLSPSALYDLLRILRLLRPFAGYAKEFAPFLDWVWSLRGSEGTWDFGPKLTQAKLSDHWRRAQYRRMDHSLLALGAVLP